MVIVMENSKVGMRVYFEGINSDVMMVVNLDQLWADRKVADWAASLVDAKVVWKAATMAASRVEHLVDLMVSFAVWNSAARWDLH